ncbi:MAG: ABC transporter permease [Gammaproteobacteria bacterium]|nr:ABC transporter permease [Gammaproteobacteria bacterium]
MNLRRFTATLAARNREFLRDRMALSWNILLPVLIVMGFAFAFTSDNQDLFKVGVKGEPAGALAFLAVEHISFIPIDDLADAIPKVERHQLDMLLDLERQRYWINRTSANGYILERLLTATGGSLSKQTVSGKEIRYVDWLIPGVLGMNVMFSSLFGVGYVIVRYRKNGVLKRLKATPLTPFEFLSAQVVSRLWLIVMVTSLVYAGTNLFVGFRMHGSYLTLLLVLTLGTLSMISLGLIIAARMANEEAANGLLNMLSWPMMLLSGVWFSLEGSPAVVQQLAQLLPLTHLTAAARAVMIDGAGLWEIRWHLAVLAVMTGIFMALGARSFRWE